MVKKLRILTQKNDLKINHVNFTRMHSNGKSNYKSIIRVDNKMANKIMEISYKTLTIVYLSGFIATIYFKNYCEKLSK